MTAYTDASLRAAIVALSEPTTAERAILFLAEAQEAAIPYLIQVFYRYENEADYEASPLTFDFAEEAFVRLGSIAVMPLVQLLEASHWGAVTGATFCLGELGDVRAIQPLIEQLEHPDLERVWETARALTKFDAVVHRPLIHALKQEGHDQQAAFSALILARLKASDAIPALSNVLADPLRASTVRQASASALGEFQDARAVEPLIAQLSDDDPAVKEACVRALGTLGGSFLTARLIQHLEKMLTDADWGVHQSAAEMLIRLGTPLREKARQVLVADLAHEEALIRLGAALSLLPTYESDALETLIALLNEPNPDLLIHVIEGLATSADPRVEPALMALKNHQDEKIQKAVEAALSRKAN